MVRSVEKDESYLRTVSAVELLRVGSLSGPSGLLPPVIFAEMTHSFPDQQ